MPDPSHRTDPIARPRACPATRLSAPLASLTALAVTLVGTLAWPSLPAAAAPGPIGPEYAADEREIPTGEWWLSCTATSGARFRIWHECTGAEPCEDREDVFLERTGGGGTVFGSSRIRVNAGPANTNSALHLICDPTGWIVAQWRDADSKCYFHRVYDEKGRPLGDPQPLAPEYADCRLRPDIAVYEDGSFVSAWAAGFFADDSAIVVRRYDADGTPDKERSIVSRSSDGWRRRAKVAVDATGIGLVTWTRDTGAGPDQILARFLDGDAKPIGDEFQVNTFPLGEVSDPVVASVGDGRFEILWGNWLEGGRVGRLVGLDADATGADAEVEPPPASMPHFGAAHVLDSAALGQRSALPATLLRGRARAWLEGGDQGVYRLSNDDGSGWLAPSVVSKVGGSRVVDLGSNRDGAWLALTIGNTLAELAAARSADARTWSQPTELPTPSGASECRDGGCEVVRSAVVGASGGTWIVATSAGHGDVVRIDVFRSSDDGNTFRSLGAIARDLGLGRGGFDLATDDAGTWVLMWADEDLWVSVSRDDGVRWSAPHLLARDIVCTRCGLDRRYDRLQIATDGGGDWVAIFASPRYRAADLGYDADVFVVRSTNDAASWTGPVAVHSDADRDGYRDADPTLATDGNGRWLAGWTSHRPAGGSDDLDADVFLAVSTDTGATWSAPTSLDVSAAQRLGMDWMPQLAADERGVWMLAWNEKSLEPIASEMTDRLLVAVADADCGNRTVDVGEQCDDGNAMDGDGCDSNCTTSGCGNGIVDPSEPCDDGNHSDQDLCMSDCTLPVCGDGIIQGPEQCDDGNDVDDDACPASCRAARCGDGYVQADVEECDDGNGSNTDACTNDCRKARCGDGYVQEGVEACDDGRNGRGGCPLGCVDPVCGDGITSYPFEDCDYLDPIYASVCRQDCTLPDVCGDANGDGLVTVVDSHRMLARSVGRHVLCPAMVCDMDVSGGVSVTDARMALGLTVGLKVGERCSIGTGPIVFWLNPSSPIGALGFEVDYAATGGGFVGSRGDVECQMLFDEDVMVTVPDDGSETTDPGTAFGSAHDDDEAGVLRFALVSLYGFSGPLDLVRCNFELPEGASDARFDIHVFDASNPELSPVVPPPSIGYRLE